VEERLLKGLLGDVFGILCGAREPPGNGANPGLVPFDKDFKRLEIPVLRSSDEGRVIFIGKPIDTSNDGLFGVDGLHEFCWHGSAPS
jgi:hypothetical protein